MEQKTTIQRATALMDFDVKAVDTAGRTLTGYASVFDVLDRSGDIIRAGAFKRTLRENPDIIALVGHDMSSMPVGAVESAVEDAKGLLTTTRVYKTARGDELLAVARERMSQGRPLGMSIGYRVKDADWEERDGDMIRVLKDLDLFEFSFLPSPAFAANPEAVTTGVKASAAPAFLRRDDTAVGKLFRSGWESKRGVLHAPGIGGRLVPLWPDAALIGQSNDVEAAKFARVARVSAEPANASAFKAWAAGVVKYHNSDMAEASLSLDERKTLSEGVDTAGGYLVPAEVLPGAIARMAERSIFQRFGTVVPTMRAEALVRRFVEHADSGSVYSSGFVGDWVGEIPSQNDADLEFGLVRIPVFKARARTKISNDLLDDAGPDGLLTWLAENGAANLAVVADLAFVSGEYGHQKPLGILSGGAATVNVAGPVANTISNSTTDAGSVPKLESLIGAVPDQYAVNGRFVMARATETAVRKLIDGQSRPVHPTTRHPASGERLLLDYPVSISSAMPLQGTADNKVIVFGALDAYTIAARNLLSVTVARETFADTDESLFVVFSRIGGVLTNPDAVRIGIV